MAAVGPELGPAAGPDMGPVEEMVDVGPAAPPEEEYATDMPSDAPVGTGAAPPIVCNLLGTVPQEPVISPHGYIFEKRAIEAYLEATGGSILSWSLTPVSNHTVHRSSSIYYRRQFTSSPYNSLLCPPSQNVPRFCRTSPCIDCFYSSHVFSCSSSS